MRLWSIHPGYLDSAGLVAVWREALLAQQVLMGATKGYRDHPQLVRFRNFDRPVDAIGAYLIGIFSEARARGYQFDDTKPVAHATLTDIIPVTRGQLRYELDHLANKLAHRSAGKMSLLWTTDEAIVPHPVFFVTEGPVESWERIAD